MSVALAGHAYDPAAPCRIHWHSMGHRAHVKSSPRPALKKVPSYKAAAIMGMLVGFDPSWASTAAGILFGLGAKAQSSFPQLLRVQLA